MHDTQDKACRETRTSASQVSVQLHVIVHVAIVSHDTNLLLPSRAARHIQHHGTCLTKRDCAGPFGETGEPWCELPTRVS